MRRRGGERRRGRGRVSYKERGGRGEEEKEVEKVYQLDKEEEE